ncbi:hypothetical protein PENTCL1PPCAC_14388 [Pristionchus entomophagus]|uniref:Nuclear receptor n=1 Tax=Pristionchus entomophagus TaxID=358040 RepID=A0AAV5TDQ1_9BILA|nr:hypothetical protein PENTCL1PPCAC_14388 [Pristionchus entomophagus]
MKSRNCLICNVSITVTHLGIDACRACAAFFKRSKIAGRTYTCRQGNRECTFRKHEKFMCRSCRYDRCIELGMTYVIPPKRKLRKNKDEGVEMEMSQPSTFSPSTASSNESILGRMETEYKASYDRRLEQEKVYVSQHNLKRMSHPSEELYTCNKSSFYEIFHVTIKETIEFLQNVFDDYERLAVPHRASLFKNFIGKFCMIEATYLSSKYFRNTFIFFASLITCVDNNNVDEWVTDGYKIERKDDFRTSLKGFAKDYSDLIIPMLKMDIMTERQFYALIVLAYCDLDPALHLPENIMETAERMRASVFDELQEYYK